MTYWPAVAGFFQGNVIVSIIILTKMFVDLEPFCNNALGPLPVTLHIVQMRPIQVLFHITMKLQCNVRTRINVSCNGSSFVSRFL